MSDRATVALFHKSLGGRFTLFSLTVIERKADYVSRDTYDVDLSRGHGFYLYHMSGAGGCGPIPVDGIYFTTGDVEVEEKASTLCNKKLRRVNATRRLRALPKAFADAPAGDLLEWLYTNGVNENAVWCSKCNDHVPGDTLCEHTWWCDEIGWYSTPSEPCKCRRRCASGPGQGAAP